MILILFRTTDSPSVRCHAEQVYGDIYPYFDWIQNARYGGVKNLDGVDYEFWEIEVMLKKNIIIFKDS